MAKKKTEAYAVIQPKEGELIVHCGCVPDAVRAQEIVTRWFRFPKKGGVAVYDPRTGAWLGMSRWFVCCDVHSRPLLADRPIEEAAIKGHFWWTGDEPVVRDTEGARRRRRSLKRNFKDYE